MEPQRIEKDRAWLLPSQAAQRMGPGLYLVATPIGNLGDITLRALDVLAACDMVICEDTRVTGKLLRHFGLKKPMLVYNDHSGEAARAAIFEAIGSGKICALVSDAGTPLISDPGFKLARTCLQKGLHVTSLPGANAVLPALHLSGATSDAFCFAGFLPPKSDARRKALRQWADVPATLILFESAPRLLKSLKDMQAVLGDREAAICRELTKLYEEARRGRLSALIEHYEAKGPPKGEIVIVLERPEARAADEAAVDRMLAAALKTMRTKEAADHVAKRTGKPKKILYARALELGKI